MTYSEKKNRILGSLLGGAAGDALGYVVEFESEDNIRKRYGNSGITSYVLDPVSGKALISDDTQMTLFTANGILVGATRCMERGIMASPSYYVSLLYEDWLTTQTETYEAVQKLRQAETKFDFCPFGRSWLLDVPELFSRRAPGMTCLEGIRKRKTVNSSDGYINIKINDSKGCGGVMRVAPMGLYYSGLEMNILDIDREGAEIAAITHSHPLGYIPAAMLTHIVNMIVYPKEKLTLTEIVRDALAAANDLFCGERNYIQFDDLMEKAIALSENRLSDIENIHQLGEGWVAEETLAIAIYCSLRHQDSFSEGIIAAVNHKGDSDSTGAVTGNILGAWLGYEKIDDKWKNDLEVADVIMEIAEDLSKGYPTDDAAMRYRDWERKYIMLYR